MTEKAQHAKLDAVRVLSIDIRDEEDEDIREIYEKTIELEGENYVKHVRKGKKLDI